MDGFTSRGNKPGGCNPGERKGKMKRILLALAITLFAVSAAQADVGLSISIGQPGFYGRVDLGPYPQPAVVYVPPPVVLRPAYVVVTRPVYVHVPPGHVKHGYRRYDGRPAYVVHDRWYPVPVRR